VGEIITAREAKRRDQEYAQQPDGGSYILDMDEKGQYCIDATRYRSVAAFINHACSEANCRLFRALGTHLDHRFPHLGLRATRDLCERTELTFNYGEAPEGACARCGGEHCLCAACRCPGAAAASASSTDASSVP
jgi:SET domain-containing protein